MTAKMQKQCGIHGTPLYKVTWEVRGKIPPFKLNTTKQVEYLCEYCNPMGVTL